MEWVYSNEDISHICVDLISCIPNLKLLCDCVLKMKTNRNHITRITEIITIRMWFKFTLSKSTGHASSQGQWRLLHLFIIFVSRSDKFSCVQDRYIINNGCLPIKLKDGWKYPPATETDYIIQNVNAAFTFDILHSMFNITSGGCSHAFLTAVIQQAVFGLKWCTGYMLIRLTLIIMETWKTQYLLSVHRTKYHHYFEI